MTSPEIADGPLRLAWRREAIAARVQELGTEITARYQGQDLVLVGVLKSAAVFLADLVRAIELPLRLDFIALRSVDGGQRTAAPPALLKDLELDITNCAVLLVEDVVDSGITMSQVHSLLQTRHPSSLRLCSLLDRRDRRVTDLPLDHVGFSVGPATLVGYGLDLGGHFRALPDLWEVVDRTGLLADPTAAIAACRKHQSFS